jgi:heterodisulfide reductase subunit B
LEKLGVEIVDIEGASCCPPEESFYSVNEIAGLVISARNISICEDMGVNILTICNGCFYSLKRAKKILKEDKIKKEKVNMALNKIGMEFSGSINVKHILEVFYDDIGIYKLKESIEKPLERLKAAVHYGCYLLRPEEILGFDDPRDPKKLDELVEILGLDSIPYEDKLMCCGAGGGLRGRDKELSLAITKRKIDGMKEAGAEIIVTACPLCHLQFDMGQKELGEDKLPVFNYAQLLALAQGIEM